jgi:hypothetical protein
MDDGSEFELVEPLDTGNESMKEITPGRFRLGLITPKLNAVKPTTEI